MSQCPKCLKVFKGRKAVNRSNIKELAKRYPHVSEQAIVAVAKGRSWKYLHDKHTDILDKD